MEFLNNTGIKDCVLEEIRNLAQKYGVEKVMLFALRARDDFYKTSDIDIASCESRQSFDKTAKKIFLSNLVMRILKKERMLAYRTLICTESGL